VEIIIKSNKKWLFALFFRLLFDGGLVKKIPEYNLLVSNLRGSHASGIKELFVFYISIGSMLKW